MSNNKDTFGDFRAIADFLAAPASNNLNDGGDPIVDRDSDQFKVDDNDPIVDPSDLNNDDVVDNKGDDKQVTSSPTQTVIDPKKDNEPITNANDNDIVDLSTEEPLIASYVQEKLYEKFGWDLGESEPKLTNMDEVVEFLQTIVEESSKPTYASPELERLNEYVTNGGKIEKYLEQRYSGNIDLDNLNLNSSSSQALVLREYFKRQGHDLSKIDNKIQKYEDTGILEEEAREAYDLLKKVRSKEAETLLEEQKNLQRDIQKRQQDYIDNVVSYIDSLQDVRGIPISATDKKKLQDYMLKPTAEGVTRYKKEFESSIRPFVESAFFTMTGETLVNKMTKRASSEAVKALKARLETKTKRGKNTGYYENDKQVKGDYSLLTNLASSLGSPKF